LAPTKKAAAQVQEKFPAQEGKGRDLLDLLAELKAEDVLGTKMGGAEFMEKLFAEGSKQVKLRVAAKRRRKEAVSQSPEGAAGEEVRGLGVEGRAAGVACEAH
jgi:hypothetical protein